VLGVSIFLRYDSSVTSIGVVVVSAITYTPIGVIHSPFLEPKNVPIQASASQNIMGKIEIYSQYAAGLKDLEGFSHLFLLYHFNRITASNLLVKPFLDDKPHGVFATRAPARPNTIGLSIVRLKKIEGTTLHIQDVDILDGTPLIDIKPYVPQFDYRENVQIGWFTNKICNLPSTQDDGRFCK
jgi:tRNA-Thr(GGU) m(6)t(6)A37 methyltransferase TsaA